MAEDVAGLPATGITPVICGDAHLGNFGFYASPERELVIDLNDFDEAHPGAGSGTCGGWWPASGWPAGRTARPRSSARRRCWPASRRTGTRCASWPRAAADALATTGWTSTGCGETATEQSLRDEIERSARRARNRTSDRALPRFTEEVDGRRRIVEEPPLITRLTDAEAEAVAEGLDGYLLTLAPHWRRVLGGYTLVDVAHKVVGVGSVGLRAYVALLEGSSPDDVVFLQLKQARRSVLAKYVHGDSAWHAHQGQRVVEYQQALQTVSDPLLGWTTVGGPAVLRAAVPQHEGHHPAGRHRRAPR